MNYKLNSAPNIRKTRILLNSKLLHILCVVMLACATLFLAKTYIFTPKNNPSGGLTSNSSPSEIRPDKNTHKWVGGPNDPKYISMPTINTEGFIQKVGVDDSNAVAVPDNIFMAGWFTKSVHPGQKGLSIIDGHVDGQTTDDGIFKNLPNIKIGEEFTIEMGSGKVLTFVVLGTKSVDTSNASEALFLHDPKVNSQLNLITCVGNYIRQVQSYDKRLIVNAKLLIQ